jgi:hypothetical protein
VNMVALLIALVGLMLAIGTIAYGVSRMAR